MSSFTLALALGLLACTSPDGGDDDPDDGDGGDSGAVEEPADPITGVWLLRVPWFDGDNDDACTQVLDHNFPGAYEADRDDPWTESDDTDRSDALYFGQIERLGEDGALLLLGRDIWIGTGADLSWTFAWLATDDVREVEEHEDGYIFSEHGTWMDDTKLELTFSGETATGTWTTEYEQQTDWEESDEWPSSVGRSVGVIPADQYLVYDEGSIDGLPQSNLRDESDCSSSRCELSVRITCSGSYDISMERTSYDDDDVYDLLEEVVHPFGTGQGG